MDYQIPTVTPVFLDRRAEQQQQRISARVAQFVKRRLSKVRSFKRSVVVDGVPMQARDILRELDDFARDASWRSLTWREQVRRDLLLEVRRTMEEAQAREAYSTFQARRYPRGDKLA